MPEKSVNVWIVAHDALAELLADPFKRLLIWGWKTFFWGSTLTPNTMRCGTCGAVAQFIEKTGMRFFTIFFIIPLIPLSGKMHVIECPTCKTRYQQAAKSAAA